MPHTDRKLTLEVHSSLSVLHFEREKNIIILLYVHHNWLYLIIRGINVVCTPEISGE